MSKLDELKEKFEGFVEEIKAKLPSKKKSDDDEDFDDEFDEDTGQVEVDPSELGDEGTQTDAGVGEQTIIDDDEGTQVDVDDEDDDEDDDDEDEKKKKQKSQIIKGALGLVLLYLVYDAFMAEDSSNELPPPPKITRKRPPRKRNPRPKPKAVPKKPAPKVVATPAPAPKVVATPAPAPKVVATPTPAPEPKIEAPVKMKADAIPPETPVKPMNNRLGETKVVKNSLAMDQKVDEILTKSVTDQMKNNKDKIDESGLDPNMTYVEPPNYRRVGRGLIYNCVGRHWACVDKFAYFQCRENTKWSRVNQKDPECVVSNVYASEKDCGVVQLHYININEPTDFCGSSSSEGASGELTSPKTKVVVP